MQRPPQQPRIVMVLRLRSGASTTMNVARLKHLAHLFQGHRIPATWVTPDRGGAELLREVGALRTSGDLAWEVPLDSTTCEATHQTFRNQLKHGLSSIVSATGSQLSLVAGCEVLLRSRTPVLAEVGIRGVISLSKETLRSAAPRSMSCGLWQLGAFAHIPQTSIIRRWLPVGQGLVKKVMADSGGGTYVFHVDTLRLTGASARMLQNFDGLLRELSWVESRNSLSLVTASEAIAQVARSRKVKPQQSILRAA